MPVSKLKACALKWDFSLKWDATGAPPGFPTFLCILALSHQPPMEKAAGMDHLVSWFPKRGEPGKRASRNGKRKGKNLNISPTQYFRHACGLSRFTLVGGFATLRTVARQVPLFWDSPGKNTGVDSHALLQGIFLTHASEPVSPVNPALQANSLPPSHQGGTFHPHQKLRKLWTHKI